MKKLTPKVHLSIANTLMCAAVVYNMVDMIVNGLDIKLIPTLISIVVMAVGVVWRYTMVKCPHCGDKFKGIHTKLPDRCPLCDGRLDKMPEE